MEAGTISSSNFPKVGNLIAVWLAYSSIPPKLWNAPVPIVGVAADWNLHWHSFRHLSPRCDVVFTDLPGVEAFGRAGIDHVHAANLYGLGPEFLASPIEERQRDIDVLFVGNIHPAVQRERLTWLGRLARLSHRWNVVIRTQVFRNEYRRFARPGEDRFQSLGPRRVQPARF